MSSMAGKIIGSGIRNRGITNPASISGLKGWYRPESLKWQDNARTTPATLDGAVVGAWDDDSGNGNHLLQATAANKPLLKLSIINGKAVVRGDGVNDSLIKSFVVGAQPSTIFHVSKSNNNTGMDTWSSAGGGVEFKRNAAGWYLYAGTVVGMNGGSSDANFHVLSIKLNGASSELYKDGALNLTGSPGGSNMDGVCLFSQAATAGWESADIAEFIIYNVLLSASDFTGVTNYLKAKYAL